MKYPLIENTYDNSDINEMIKVLKSGQLTMSQKVFDFEKEFAKYIGSEYAVMVNSGSSANLLAISVAVNHMRKNKLNKGDKIIVPNVCWSTTVWPLIQLGLSPVFVDIDPQTMNIDIEELNKSITPDIRGIMLVHIMGNCTNMIEIMSICEKNKLVLIEDTCESLGSSYNNKKLGSFGDFGTYSFYYSHHITTIEGGMVICNDKEDYELLKCLRSHGWIRQLDNKEQYIKENPNIDPRFLFVNLGYNLRPMEIQGAMGLNQLKKLDIKNNNRNINRNKILNKLLKDSRNSGIFSSPTEQINSEPAWFSLTIILGENYEKLYKSFLTYLTESGVENRPVVTGNFARQPVFEYLNIDVTPESFKGAEILHNRGFFIGLSCEIMEDEKISELVEIFYEFFS